MSRFSKVVWSEGLFLQPQHFQQQERYFENLILQQPNPSGLTTWGILECTWDPYLLALGKFGLTLCRGVLPDGTVFDAPALNKLPQPIDIPSDCVDAIVYLSLPLALPGSTEIGLAEIEQNSYRYQAESLEIKDTVSNGGNFTQMQVGQCALELRLSSDSLGGYSCLGVAKIKEVLLDKSLQLDDRFISPCLNIYAVPRLQQFVKELLNLLRHRAEVLALQSFDTIYGEAPEIMDILLLNTLNQLEAHLYGLVGRKIVHPEKFYLYLCNALGSLVIFNEKQRHLDKLPFYQHQDLESSFDPLMTELRRALSRVIQHKAVCFNLETNGYGMWLATLDDKNLVQTAQFVLAISAEVPIETLSQQILPNIKVASATRIQELITHVMPGISLQRLAMVPREIPVKADYLYYSLNKGEALWHDLMIDNAISVYIGKEIPGLTMKLWAIRDAYTIG